MAISSLYFTGITPSATAALSKAQKAFITSGARLSIFFSLARFSFLYIRVIVVSKIQILSISHRDDLEVLGGDFSGVGSYGRVVDGLKFNQVTPQRDLSGGTERGERPLSWAVVLAEELDGFGRRKWVAHQRDAAREPHVGEGVQSRAHRSLVAPAHRRREARGR